MADELENMEIMSALVNAFEHQEKIFAVPFGILEDAIAEHAFPAASVAISLGSHLIALKAFGRFTYDADAPLAAPETLFDLASVTKIIATTATAMVLYERGLLDLDALVAGIVPEFVSSVKDPRRADVTLRMLLAHSSGLPAYEKLFLKARD